MVTNEKEASEQQENQQLGADLKRERSTIEFPYMDLETALSVANGIHSRVGGGTCQHDELAVELGLSSSSSGYRTRVAAARLFGLVASERGSEGIRLTPLGNQAVDRTQERAARAEAFLNVPLFKRLYDEYRGRVLPPAAALQREVIGFGVASKQAERARQIMERSAETSGFFESGRDRLVLPAGLSLNDGRVTPATGSEAPPRRQQEVPPTPKGSGGGDGTGQYHPFIQGLLQTLPDPNSDANWPAEDRVKWLQTAANIFDLIYKGDGGIEVRSATASRSPRPE